MQLGVKVTTKVMDSTACTGHEPLTPEPQPATTPENIAEQQQQQQEGGPSVSRQSAPWTDNEEEALREGVRTFGEGRWDVVLDTYVARFAAGRTADDLNDKWCSLPSAHLIGAIVSALHP